MSNTELQKVHELFGAQVDLQPASIAVSDVYGDWSYRELDFASDKLANFLLYSGVAANETVLIRADRSPTLVVCLIAVMKTGGRFLILDSIYPEAYLRKVANIVKPKVFLSLVGSKTGCLDASSLSLEIGVFLELNKREKEKFISNIPVCKSSNKRPCSDEMYLALTSGSTGCPKIVMGDHNPVAIFLSIYVRKFQLGSTDVFSMLSGLSHDPILRDIFTPLSLGARLAVPSQDSQSTADKLITWLKSEKVTVIHATPEIVRYLLRGSSAEVLSDVRYVVIGGDVLSWTLLDSLRSLTPNADFINTYGATETPQIASYFLLKSELARTIENFSLSKQTVPIGRGLGETDLLVLNEQGAKCRTNEVGEIFVVGTQLARGYLGDDAATDSKFIELNIDDKKLLSYRTGDFGKRNDDGYVEYVGRKDHQLKVGSRRISLLEIEETLKDILGFQQIKVIFVKNEQSEPGTLVAFIVQELGEAIDVTGMRARVLSHLPQHMCPSKYMPLEKFPLLLSGKIDLSRLEELGVELCKPHVNKDPLSELEKRLCDTWSIVLGQQINGRDVTKNFFEVGGNSLLAIELVNVLNREYQTHLNVTNIFTYSSIRDIASFLRKELAHCTKSNTLHFPDQGRHRFLANRPSIREFSGSE